MKIVVTYQTNLDKGEKVFKKEDTCLRWLRAKRKEHEKKSYNYIDPIFFRVNIQTVCQ